MATDFFDRQDHAREQTRRLVVMFALSVIAIILLVYLALAFGSANIDHSKNGAHVQPSLWNPVLFGWVTFGTLLVIGLGSLYKISELSGGGEHVALMLGGRAVDPQTRDPAERRLLNVVEEMSLASGIAVPPVFVLDHEAGINAFAAGHQPSDAVVAVSAGALQYLTRDELQGVMGHEFSHILNGDMRLNLRLIGVVYGILVLAVLGYYVMRFSGSISSSSDDGKKAGGAAGVFLFGLILMVLGYIGVFFGNLIKSAISRQREFLADASAVQFTRNPSGIGGALKKIGGLSEGSRIRDAHAQEISHMFFGNAFSGGFFNLFATHPPLEERIRALEPDFDGQFPEVEPVASEVEAAPKRSRTVLPNILGMPGAAAAVVPAVAALDAGSTTQRIGRPSVAELSRAGQLIGELPQPLLEAVREPFVAPAVIYALLLSREDQSVRARQLQLLQSRIERSLFGHVQEMVPLVDSLLAAARLPLVELAVPALKKASQSQYAQFRDVVEASVNVDGTVDLYEYCLRTVLFSYLDVHFGLKRPAGIRYRSVKAVAQPLAIALSTLAYVGHTRPEDAQRAYACGAENLPLPAAMAPLGQCRLPAFDAALGELAQSSPEVKRSIIGSMAACVAADGKILPAETEVLRAVAAVLGCPMPPLA